jgi:Na+/melibiose symporter-like transporter
MSIAPRKALMADITAITAEEIIQSEAYRLRRSLLIAGTCIGSIIAGAILFFSHNDYRLVFSGAVTPSCMALALAAYPISAIVDRTLKVRLLLAGFLLHIIVYFELAVVSDRVQIWCLFALYGLHLAIIQGLMLDLVDRAVDPARRVTAAPPKIVFSYLDSAPPKIVVISLTKSLVASQIQLNYLSLPELLQELLVQQI